MTKNKKSMAQCETKCDLTIDRADEQSQWHMCKLDLEWSRRCTICNSCLHPDLTFVCAKCNKVKCYECDMRVIQCFCCSHQTCSDHHVKDNGCSLCGRQLCSLGCGYVIKGSGDRLYTLCIHCKYNKIGCRSKMVFCKYQTDKLQQK